MEQLCIIACNSLAPEISHILQIGVYPDVTLKSFPAVCIGCTITDDRIIEIIGNDPDQYSKIVVIVSSCRNKKNISTSNLKNVELIRLEQCFEILFPLPTIYHYINEGNYLVSNGWLRNYNRHIREWGFEPASAKSFFRESIRKIILLETVIPGDYIENLIALSEYMGVSYEILPIGTSHLRSFLDSIILGWRNDLEKKTQNNRIAKLARESADYSLVFAHLKTLINHVDEQIIIREITSLINLLFAPEQIIYHHYLNGIEANFDTNAFSPSSINLDDSITIEINHQHEILGLFEVKKVRFPQYIPQYKPMEQVISQIGGLAISNARRYSELERTRQALSISEEHFRTMFEQAPLGIALINSLNGQIRNVNSKFAEIAGRTRDEMRTIDWMSITHPDDIQEDLNSMARLNAGEIDGFQMNKRYIKPDGSIAWINMTIEPIKVEDKSKPFHLCMIEDITERKQAENEKERTQKLLEDSQRIGKIGGWEIDIDTMELNWTKEMYTIHEVDLTFKPMVNHRVNFYTPESLPIIDKAVQDTIEQGGSYEVDVEIITAKGNSRSIKTIGKADLKSRRVFGFFQDITERKLAEEALKESELRLRELVATKDKFFSIIAHDLKSPFNSILGLSNLLVEQIRERNHDGIEEYAGIIQESSTKVFDLLINLLEWSRSQTGRMEFSPEYIELVALINEVAELLSDTAQQKSIIMIRKLPRNILVFADKAMISAILRNLISNAIKFTNPGGQIVISVELKKDELEICVQDNGVGIKKEAIGKLFLIDESHTTLGTQNEKGTGLGLILCKEFIEKHSGRIWVESEVGKGTTFYFTLGANPS